VVRAHTAERWVDGDGSSREPDGWWPGRVAFGFRVGCRESAAQVCSVCGVIPWPVLMVCLESCRAAGGRSVSIARLGRPRFPAADVCRRSYLASEGRGV
jgi:hypothetical protein